jgi:prevent-host-death family protein
MWFASVAELKNNLSAYLACARKRQEPLIITRRGKPYARIQPINEEDFECLEWKGLAARRFSQAGEGEEDALYDYL